MRLKLFLFLLISANSLFAQSKFRDFVVDESKRIDLSKACRNGLQSHYRNGHDLNISEVREKAIPLNTLENTEDFNRYDVSYEKEGMRNNLFYHYFYWDDVRGGKKRLTPNAEIFLKEGLQRSALDTLIPRLLAFQFIEKNKQEYMTVATTHENNSARNVLYVAGDPYSSSFYGDTLITFDFDPKSLIYYLTTKEEYLDTKKIVKYSIQKNFPQLAIDCHFELESDGNLLFLVMEDSNIDLVQYFKKTAWFQVINTDKIRSAKMTKIYQGKPNSKISPEMNHKKINKLVDKALRKNKRHVEVIDRN